MKIATLVKIIGGLAYDSLGWRPGIRGDAATEIASATERIGSPVSDDTVRDVLRKAAEFVDPETEKGD